MEGITKNGGEIEFNLTPQKETSIPVESNTRWEKGGVKRRNCAILDMGQWWQGGGFLVKKKGGGVLTTRDGGTTKNPPQKNNTSQSWDKKWGKIDGGRKPYIPRLLWGYIQEL